MFAAAHPDNGYGAHSYLKRCRHHNVEGAVLMGTDPEDPEVRRLARSDLPTVGVDVELDGPATTYVISDNIDGAARATRHFHIGIVNKVLVDYTHVLSHRPVWLIGENSLWAIIIPSVWRGLPFAMLIFLAGLQAMPRELHEAAAIDGAGAWRRFRYITLPLLRPLIAVQLLFGVIYATYQFAIPYVMLGTNPGPDADLLMTLIVRQSFSNNLFGFGSAVSTLLMLAMLVWVAVWYRAFRRDLEVA